MAPFLLPDGVSSATRVTSLRTQLVNQGTTPESDPRGLNIVEDTKHDDGDPGNDVRTACRIPSVGTNQHWETYRKREVNYDTTAVDLTRDPGFVCSV